MKTQLRRLQPSKLIVIGLLSSVLASASVSWAQIVVTTLADSGPGSLRQAIIDASADGVANTITFDPMVFPPPPALPGVILLATPLPNLTGTGDTIDGSGAGVVLDGSALAAGSVGLNVRRSNYTIRGLTIQNFPNDGIRVDTPPPPTTVLTVTGAVIDGNTLLRNGTRGIHVLGGIGPGKTVSATVTNNTLEENVRSIQVLGNTNTPGDPGGNTVTALLDSNILRGSVTEGITILGGNVAGSDNSVTATFSNNVVEENGDEGIVAVGCATSSTGSNNSVNVTIIDNTVRGHPAAGIAVTGGGLSTCVGNTIQFEISGNNVVDNRTQNITVSGGSGTGHDVQGIVMGNSANNSGEGFGITVSGGAGTNNNVHNIIIRENQAKANGVGDPASGDGIQIGGGSGVGNTVHNITVTRNETRDNYDEGISITGASGTANIVTGIEISHNNAGANLDQGIEVSGGSGQGNQVSDILITNNTTTRNGNRGIRLTVGTGTNNTASVRAITSNNSNNNGTDGIGIGANVPGSGTLIFRNRTNANGQDGIDIDSTGYIVRSNVANANAVDGINALGNTNGGGNIANSNASCNTPGCF